MLNIFGGYDYVGCQFTQNETLLNIPHFVGAGCKQWVTSHTRIFKALFENPCMYYRQATVHEAGVGYTWFWFFMPYFTTDITERFEQAVLEPVYLLTTYSIWNWCRLHVHVHVHVFEFSCHFSADNFEKK